MNSTELMNIVAGATALLFLLTLCEEISAASSCDYTRYKLKNGKCRLCEPCGVGEKVTENCGRDASGNLVRAKCEPCGKGNYQDQPAARECKSCTVECREGYTVKHKCNATSDMVCECMSGWYNDHGTCRRCTYCCADNYKLSPFYEKKCGDDGMGKCSCKRHESCQERTCTAENTTTSPSTPVSHNLTIETQKTNATWTGLATAFPCEAVSSIFPSWWIFAPVTFALVFLVLLVILLWRHKKRVSGRLQDNGLSPPGTVEIQGTYERVTDPEILNMAKLMQPAENSSETSGHGMVCSCSLESTQHVDRLKSLSTTSTKYLGKECNEDDIPSGQCLSEVLDKTTESTAQTTAPAETSTNIAQRDATCTEQDDLQKIRGCLPIPDTTYPPPDPNIVLPGPQCVCQQVVYITQQEEMERYKAKMTNGHSHKETHGGCPYRPITSRKGHSCSECQPQPNDLLWSIVERNCLQEELREKLNQNNDWKKILTFMRKENSIETLESRQDSAHATLNMLRTLEPHLTLGEFFDILKDIKRPDLQQVITEHHMKCDLCKKNSFDSSSP